MPLQKINPLRRVASRGSAAALLGAGMLALTACANPAADELNTSSRSLIGMSKTQLVSCAGRPGQSLQSGSGETLTYSIGIPIRGPGPSTSVGVGGGSRSGVGVGVGMTFPLGPGFSQSYCEAVFKLTNGAVTDVTYNASSSVRGSGYRVCYEIVGPCLGAR